MYEGPTQSRTMYFSQEVAIKRTLVLNNLEGKTTFGAKYWIFIKKKTENKKQEQIKGSKTLKKFLGKLNELGKKLKQQKFQ